MILAEDLQNYIRTHNGNYGEEYTIGLGFCIQVYSDGRQATIFHNGRAILRIAENDDIALRFNMPDNNDLKTIDYSTTKTIALNGNTTVLDLYDTFSNHPDIEDALVALLLLK